MRWLPLLLVLAWASGCTITTPGGDEDVRSTWDLRDSNRLSDVGWPEDLDASEYTVDASRHDVTVLLPGGLEITEGTRLFARLAPGDRPEGDVEGTALESVGINLPDEDAEAALERATRLAETWGADPAPLRAAVEAEAGLIATTRAVELGEDVRGEISLRTRGDGSGFAFVDVHWGPDPMTEG
jgi:hypothetical protein